jgi:hypothetical protein
MKRVKSNEALKLRESSVGKIDNMVERFRQDKCIARHGEGKVQEYPRMKFTPIATSIEDKEKENTLVQCKCEPCLNEKLVIMNPIEETKRS